MKTKAKITIATFAVSCCALLNSASAAVGEDYNTQYTGMRKFSRGVANVFTGIFEVPKNMVKEDQEHGPVAAYSTGLFQGIANFVTRTGTGFYEIFTCMSDDKEPIVTPEYLFMPYEEEFSFDVNPNDHSDHPWHAQP